MRPARLFINIACRVADKNECDDDRIRITGRKNTGFPIVKLDFDETDTAVIFRRPRLTMKRYIMKKRAEIVKMAAKFSVRCVQFYDPRDGPAGSTIRRGRPNNTLCIIKTQNQLKILLRSGTVCKRTEANSAKPALDLWSSLV